MDSLESACPCRRQVRCLVQEDLTFHGTAKPAAIAPLLQSPAAAATELTRLEPAVPAREATLERKPLAAPREKPAHSREDPAQPRTHKILELFAHRSVSPTVHTVNT